MIVRQNLWQQNMQVVRRIDASQDMTDCASRVSDRAAASARGAWSAVEHFQRLPAGSVRIRVQRADGCCWVQPKAGDEVQTPTQGQRLAGRRFPRHAA